MPRKKKIEEEEEIEKEEEFEWDKTKIAITIILLLVILIGAVVGRQLVLGDRVSMHKSVESANTSIKEPLLPSQDTVKQQLTALEEKASQISVKDIATSSPQVQELLQQLQKLPKTPGNVIKQTCQQICNGL